jgi:hypothetical protein
MSSLRAINIGVREQAIILLALVALWYWSLVLMMQDIKVDRLGLVWGAAFCLLPFVTALFAIIMVVSYKRNGRPYRWWVRAAVVLTLSPWLLFLAFLVSAGYI